MKISFKVLIIPGINNHTISGAVETIEGATLSWLLNHISKYYLVDLQEASSCIALLDGRPLDLKRDKDISIENNSELLVAPMISGG